MCITTSVMDLKPTKCKFLMKCLSKPRTHIGLSSKITSMMMETMFNNVPTSSTHSWSGMSFPIIEHPIMTGFSLFCHSTFFSNFATHLIRAVSFEPNSVTLFPLIELFLAANPTSIFLILSCQLSFQDVGFVVCLLLLQKCV